MPTPPLSDEALLEAVALRNQHATLKDAADAAGLSWSAFNNRLTRAAERGLDGSVPHPLPLGQRIRGVSTLYDAGGNKVLEWVKTRADADRLDSVVEALREAFDGYRGRALPCPAPVRSNDDLATVYAIGDHHLGLYAWAAETGADYDLAIGEAVLMDAMGQLVASAPPAGVGIVLNLGDFVHADNSDNKTARSGNSLDVDTRYAKVLQTGVALLIHCVELALQRHARVIVRSLPGNHDPHTALALSVALDAFFSSEPRVTVDTDPSKFWWWRFGRVFLAATHGDMVRPEEMPGVMAAYRPQDWGETRHRYAYLGHVHHRSKGGGEQHGVVWETFQTLAAKDAWHSASGYSSGRSMTAITHHRERGEVMRHVVSINAGD